MAHPSALGIATARWPNAKPSHLRRCSPGCTWHAACACRTTQCCTDEPPHPDSVKQRLRGTAQA
eukprot:360747-Chlamydomonas_euryale.AAC.1